MKFQRSVTRPRRRGRSYTGDMNDSAKMNIWLHRAVMIKLAENGGKVPESLKH